MTRWHDDDIVGRLTNPEIVPDKKIRDLWRVKKFPAVSPDGKALCPKRYPYDDLMEKKATVGRRVWSALYMQNPSPDEGLFFKKDMFQWYDRPKDLPDNLRFYAASDHALTEKQENDATVLIPFAFQFSGLHGLDLSPPTTRQTDPMGLAMLGLLTGVGAWCMARLGRANPWFMGALLVAMVLSLAGITLSAIPTPLSNLAQLFIAISLGVRFTPAFIQLAPRWLFSVAVGTLVLIGVSLALAWALSRATNLPLATLILSTAPGGIAEMAITAKVLQLGVPVVTAFQVCRLVAVLLLTEPLYRWRAHPPAQDGV